MSESTYRALCSELVKIEDAMNSGNSLMSNQGQALDGFSTLAAFRDVANRARAALAHTEDETLGSDGGYETGSMWTGHGIRLVSMQELADGEINEPTDEALLNLSEIWDGDPVKTAKEAVFIYSRPKFKPISSSERLPKPEDCDEKGRCWVGYASFVEDSDYGTITYNPCWELCTFTQGDTHWLPHWALPIPTEDSKK